MSILIEPQAESSQPLLKDALCTNMNDCDNLTGSMVKFSPTPAKAVPTVAGSAAKNLQQRLQDVAAIGEQVRNAGVAQVQRGIAVVVQQGLRRQ